MTPSGVQQSLPGNSAISLHEVLRREECENLRNQVLALREHWTQRGEGSPFFTLGAAAYLDATGQREAYLRAAREVNPLLRENFDWLYERVRSGFEDLFGQPVVYDAECPLPGFHIFCYQGADQSNDRPSARAHFDLQWMHAMPGQRPEKSLSFTLPVEEPSGGSSLAIWPVRCDTARPEFDARAYAAGHSPQTLQYSRGQMVVHDGLLLHAIGCAGVARPEGYRITFQGHGVRFSGRWKLYW
jgi:hypothetical protein